MVYEYRGPSHQQCQPLLREDLHMHSSPLSQSNHPRHFLEVHQGWEDLSRRKHNAFRSLDYLQCP